MTNKLRISISILLILAILVSFYFLLPFKIFAKAYLLISIAALAYLVKLVLFNYVSLELIYKKSKETATGAGMLAVSFSIFLLGILNFIK